MILYTVKSGDTLSSVARSFNVSSDRIVFDNGLEMVDTLVVGQTLIILEPEVTYTAQAGDTLFLIAERFGTSVAQLQRNNPYLASSKSINPGQVVVIAYTDTPDRTARINGYAYPFISLPLLRRSLPFLSTITVFGYGFTETGGLLAPEDEMILEEARAFSVTPILLLTSIIENGNFSTERSSRLFNDLMLQNTVLNNIADVMEQKGYRGLDIDFEFVDPNDRNAFISFIENAASIMHENGFFVNVDLAPKSSRGQSGLLYSAHDYPVIGSIADTVFLMTYEWGYTYGPPLAVAPANQVERIVSYGVSEIPPDKILLGIPNYGYDWPLPFEKGITKATTIGNQYAVTIAGRYNAEIQFDNESMAPFFYYSASDIEHVVWFEDVRSIQAKLDIRENFGLRGFGYWNLMRPFAQNLSLLSVKYIPERVQ